MLGGTISSSVVLTCFSPYQQMAKLDKKQIDEVLIVGGGSRIPALQSAISSFFDGKELSKHVNPEESVVIGKLFFSWKKYA
jgi:molecular chaperone DnaK (HSP70)